MQYFLKNYLNPPEMEINNFTKRQITIIIAMAVRTQMSLSSKILGIISP